MSLEDLLAGKVPQKPYAPTMEQLLELNKQPMPVPQAAQYPDLPTNPFRLQEIFKSLGIDPSAMSLPELELGQIGEQPQPATKPSTPIVPQGGAGVGNVGQSPLNMLLERTGDVPKEMTALPNGRVGGEEKLPAQTPQTPQTPQQQGGGMASLVDLLQAGGKKGLDILRPGLSTTLFGGQNPQGGALEQLGKTLAGQMGTQAPEQPAATPADQVNPPDIAATLTETAKGVEGEEKGMFDKIGDWMEDEGNRRMLLGISVALSQGRSAAEAIGMGVQMRDQFAAGKAEAGVKGEERKAKLELTKSQTKKNLAEAVKAGREAGLKADELKGFRNSFETILGEAGGLGDPLAVAKAQAQAAQQELAGNPESTALNDLVDSSLKSILMEIDGMKAEKAKAELQKVKNQFGADKVDAIARKIVGG